MQMRHMSFSHSTRKLVLEIQMRATGSGGLLVDRVRHRLLVVRLGSRLDERLWLGGPLLANCELVANAELIWILVGEILYASLHTLHRFDGM